jgi:hypothetical protein
MLRNHYDYKHPLPLNPTNTVCSHAMDIPTFIRNIFFISNRTPWRTHRQLQHSTATCLCNIKLKKLPIHHQSQSKHGFPFKMIHNSELIIETQWCLVLPKERQWNSDHFSAKIWSLCGSYQGFRCPVPKPNTQKSFFSFCPLSRSVPCLAYLVSVPQPQSLTALSPRCCCILALSINSHLMLGLLDILLGQDPISNFTSCLPHPPHTAREPENCERYPICSA